MATLYKYRIKCTTDNQYEYQWAETEPTTCPTNTAHTIDSAQTAIVETKVDDFFDGVPKNDDKPLFVFDQFPAKTKVRFSGVGDNFAAGTIGGGQAIKASTDAAGDTTLTVRFVEPIYLAGGRISWKNAGYGDYFNFNIKAPSSAGIETANAGAGTHDKTPIGGGINMYIPNGTTTGSHDLDLTTCETNLTSSDVDVKVTKAVPVPASGGNTGYFDLDLTTGDLTANNAGTGSHNLFDGELTLTNHIDKEWMLNDGIVELKGNYRSELFLPHWKMEIVVHKETTTTSTFLDFVGRVYAGRKHTISGTAP